MSIEQIPIQPPEESPLIEMVQTESTFDEGEIYLQGFDLPAISPAAQRLRGEFTYDDPTSEQYVTPGDSRGMCNAVTDTYFHAQVERLPYIAARYERLRSRDPELSVDEPRATIVIATANETSITLRDALQEIAAQKGIEQDEILLYSNQADSLDEADKAESQAKIDSLVAEFKQSHPHLKLRSIIEEYVADGNPDDPTTLRIGRIRHDIIDLVAWDARQRGGFKIDHPIIVLDADTKQMTKDAFEKFTDTLTAPNSNTVLAHAKTAYLFDSDRGLDESGEISDVRKMAVLQEIRRRQYFRIQHNDRKKSRYGRYYEHYPEEWGTAITLGAILTAGNYYERGKMDENKHLMHRVDDAGSVISDITHYAKPTVTERVDDSMQYLTDITIRSSGRRQEAVLRQWIAGGQDEKTYDFAVRNLIGSGRQHGEFSHEENMRLTPDQPDPNFADAEQSSKIIDAVLDPDEVYLIRRGEDVPMPNPDPLIQRLGLPPRKSSPESDSHNTQLENDTSRNNS